MVIQQKHIIIFQYPQDYEAEYEFCKTKGDEWVHKGKDTRCSVYEHEMLYIAEQTEPQTDCPWK